MNGEQFIFNPCKKLNSNLDTQIVYFKTMLNLFGYSHIEQIKNGEPVIVNSIDALYNYLRVNYRFFFSDKKEELIKKIENKDELFFKFLELNLGINISIKG